MVSVGLISVSNGSEDLIVVDTVGLELHMPQTSCRLANSEIFPPRSHA